MLFMELNIEDMTAEALVAALIAKLQEAGAQAKATHGGGRFGAMITKLPNGQVFEINVEEII